jgi:hypothetical protein
MGIAALDFRFQRNAAGSDGRIWRPQTAPAARRARSGTAGGAIADWFNGPPQKDAASLKIIGLDGDGGLAPAALVTPYGAYDLRPDAGRYVTRFNSTRSLSVNFH